MSRRLGLCVSGTALRAVAVERRCVTWAAERTIEGPHEIADGLADLAADRPPRVTRIRIAVAGTLIQAKVLTGFPRLTAVRLDRAVGLQSSRWFLKNGRPLVTGAARVGPDGKVFAAAVERDVLDRLCEGAARAGLRLEGVGTAAAACARLLGNGDHAIPFDSQSDHVTVQAGVPVALRRTREGGDGSSAFLVPGLGQDGARFFPAYAVAVSLTRPVFALAGMDAERAIRRRRLSVRIGILTAVLWVTAAGLFVLRTGGVIRGAEREMAALGLALEAAVAVERDLALANGLLGAVREAQSTQSHDTQLLATLTRALPDSVHLASIRRGPDDRVVLVGIGPSAAHALAALGRTPGIEAPALQGGVTRETSGGRSVERFIVSLVWRPGEAR